MAADEDSSTRAERTLASQAGDAWIEAAQAWIEQGLAELVCAERRPEWPGLLREAMEYVLLAGGKRLRPALVRMVCEELGGTSELALPGALAIELVHTYSLVHDDLPCMDDDDLRRGRPTCHVAYGEDVAVLTGDALLTLAFEVLGGCGARAGELALVLARAAGSGGMVGGQVLDLRSDLRAPGHEGIREVHRLKTAALMGAASELGATAAGADADARAAAADFGRALGLCFQAVDDLLDVTGDAATLGKTPGKDAALERDTLVAELGLDGARAEAQLQAERARAAAARLGWVQGHRAVALIDRMLERRT
ncbi:polyprenyl synthetase family protein [Engelhardtia mirabilis]|uniref:polyprenyl synthetase family protein n=1 Tax=Engelhardtia mirabilis TaxID=2528011 RepID=UPI003AF3BD06